MENKNILSDSEDNVSFLRDLKCYIKCFFNEFKVLKINCFLSVLMANTNPNINTDTNPLVKKRNVVYIVVDCRGTNGIF